MNEIATLKGMKCPRCGAEDLIIRGKPGGAGKAAAGVLIGGNVANLIASGRAAKNVQTGPIALTCGKCKHKFESLPLLAPEEDILSTPCTITFTRLGSMVGCAVVQIVYLNGVNCGPVKNGKSLTLETSNHYNTMYVTDQYGAAFPGAYRFEAEAGGHVDVKFKRKFVE